MNHFFLIHVTNDAIAMARQQRVQFETHVGDIYSYPDQTGKVITQTVDIAEHKFITLPTFPFGENMPHVSLKTSGRCRYQLSRGSKSADGVTTDGLCNLFPKHSHMFLEKYDEYNRPTDESLTIHVESMNVCVLLAARHNQHQDGVRWNPYPKPNTVAYPVLIQVDYTRLDTRTFVSRVFDAVKRWGPNSTTNDDSDDESGHEIRKNSIWMIGGPGD